MTETTRQLAAIREELLEAQSALHRLAQSVDAEAWGRRPDPNRWSPGECVVHLNLTTEAYLPSIRELIQKGSGGVRRPPRRHRMDPIGYLLYKAVAPSGRFKVKTSDAIVPKIETSKEQDVADFDRLQGKLIECIDESEGLPLSRLRMRSPIDARFKYNLYSAYRVIPAHQLRHLGQARRAAGGAS